MPTGSSVRKWVKRVSAEPAVRVERHAADQVAERGAEEHRERRAGRAEGDVPAGAPEGIVHVAPELDGDAAQDQGPEHQEDRQVEAGEARRPAPSGTPRTARRRRRAATPRCRPRTGRWRRGPGGARRRSSPRTVQRPGAEVEAVEHDVGREHHRGDRKPELNHAPPRRGGRARGRSRARPGTGTAGRARSRARRTRSG